MPTFRYKLQPYNGARSRFRCPSCKKTACFVRYIDSYTGDFLGEQIGRCNREISCGYHKKPSTFPANSGRPQKINRDVFSSGTAGISFIDRSFLLTSMQRNMPNNFLDYLQSLFGSNIATELKEKYHIGSSNRWPGATVFWQCDSKGAIRTGKIMQYSPATGKRLKEPYNHIDWVHSALTRRKMVTEFNLEQCFFGEHLLQTDASQLVAIVESEKTAVIASVYLPQFIWVAAGSLHNLKPERFGALQKSRVVVFPDLKCTSRWQSISQEIQRHTKIQITVSDFLERNASVKDIESGFDLADYLVKRDTINPGWALTDEGYPIFWDLQVKKVKK